MKTHGTLFRALVSFIFAAAALSAQEKVAVLPPQGGRSVSEINKKTVRSAFLDFLTEPGSGYAAHDRNATDHAVMEPGGRTVALYDEKTAKDVGKKLGVQLVCIIDLTREENEFLIECKLISVETGLARSKSEIVSGVANAEIKKASETVVRKLMATEGASTARPAAADHTAAHRPSDHDSDAAKTAPALPRHPLDSDDFDDDSDLPFNAMWVVGFSMAKPVGDAGRAFNVGFGGSCSFEMKYFRVRAEMTYFRAGGKTRDFPKRPIALYSYLLAADGVYRFGAIDGGFYVFGGAAGLGGDIDYENWPGYEKRRETGYGAAFSAGFGYNFSGQFGVEASYTVANKAIKLHNIDWTQASIRFRF